MSKKVRAALTEEVRVIKEADGAVPVLAVILVGSRKDSQTYVNMKTKACAEVGIGAQQHDLPETTTTVSTHCTQPRASSPCTSEADGLIAPLRLWRACSA